MTGITLLLPLLLAPPAQVVSAPAAPPTIHRIDHPLTFDLDGDGTPEPVAIEYAGFRGPCATKVTLIVGDRRAPIWNDDGGIWIEPGPPTTQTIRVTAVDLSPRGSDAHLLVEQGATCDSEYTTWFDLAYGEHRKMVFGLKGGALARLWSQVTHDPTVKIRKDGTFELDRHVCARAATYATSWEDGADAKVKRMGRETRITERFRLKDGVIKAKTVRKATVKSKCGGQRFCPFVYVGDPPRRVGEILRSQVGRAAWRDDRLRLPTTTGRTLRVRLAEEKFDEITWLDGVWIEVDGQRRLPVGCGSAAWCRVDGRLHRLRPGERLDLRFDGLEPGQRPILGANGYYDLGRPTDRGLE